MGGGIVRSGEALRTIAREMEEGIAGVDLY